MKGKVPYRQDKVEGVGCTEWVVWVNWRLRDRAQMVTDDQRLRKLKWTILSQLPRARLESAPLNHTATSSSTQLFITEIAWLNFTSRAIRLKD